MYKRQVEAAPVVEEAPAVAAAPVAEAAPAVEAQPASEEAPVVDAAPVVEEAPAVAAEPAAVEAAPAEEAAAVEEAQPVFDMSTLPRRSVAFIGSECHPFVKTGGLGDVMYALPRELARLNCDVRVILPRYACIPQEYQDKMVYRGEFYMDLGNTGRSYYVGIMEYINEGGVYDLSLIHISILRSATMSSRGGISSVRRMYRWTCLALSPTSSPTLSAAFNLSTTWREVKSVLSP